MHTGDNLTGEGEGDDEVIKVDLSKLPSEAKYIVFTVNSFLGQTFETVSNAFCRAVDEASQRELAIFNLTDSGSYTGIIMAKLYRHNGEWKFHAIGECVNGTDVDDMIEPIKRCI